MSLQVLAEAAIVAAPVAGACPAPVIALSDLPTNLPTCSVEDCSDVPMQVGIWTDPDTGDAWYSQGEYSFLVIDNTVSAR
jgi:hypothetical protein